MIGDYSFFAFKQFSTRKLRTFLTMLGIFIGIAAVVSLVSLGQGLQKVVREQFESMGANKIMISPSGGMMGMGGRGYLDESDLRVIQNSRGIHLAGGMMFKFISVEFGNEKKHTFVIGLPQDESKKIIEEMSNFKVSSGRDLKQGDKLKIAVGSRFGKKDFFDKKVGIGDRLLVNNQKFEVVGIMAPIGNPSDDSQVYVSLDTAVELFGGKKEFSIIMADVVDSVSPAVAAESIKKALRRHRSLAEGDEDFEVQTFEQMIESFGSIFTIVQAVLIGIAGISLLVGGIGIMNTMYTSVFQRTNEIGIMKAVGARNSDILKIFLIESGFLGMAGGAVGIAIGFGISKMVEFSASQAGLGMLKASFPWYLIIGSLLFSFVVGGVAGCFPAVRASRLKPVDALRYE